MKLFAGTFRKEDFEFLVSEFVVGVFKGLLGQTIQADNPETGADFDRRNHRQTLDIKRLECPTR